jgi:cytochrome o ubiquinol oxidase subunit IV
MEKISPENEKWSGTVSSYALGFFFSIILTFTAYFLVVKQIMTGPPLAITIGALALTQAVIQLIYFLHLGQESTPRWNLLVFIFMAIITGILVIGSLWIMYNLDYRMMQKL